MKRSGSDFDALIARAESLTYMVGEIADVGGPYRGEAMSRFEGTLHELAHVMVLRGRLSPAENGRSVASHMLDLSDVAADAQEAETVALELCVARRLGYPLNERRLLAYVAKNSLRAAMAIPLRYRTVWLRAAVRNAICDQRITAMAKTVVAALSATESARTS